MPVDKQNPMNDSQYIVNLKNVHKTYMLGAVELNVLKDINISFRKGQFSAIMGPSGSGKSTLLNILGCLDKPTKGSYELDGTDISRFHDDELSSVRGRKIGFIFQSFNLISQLNIIENICVPMYYQNVPEKEGVKKAEKLADMVGLTERLGHRPYQLSGGQQQRVAIARSLANDPSIILADEPTGNLDSKSGTEILNILDSLHQQGKTVIMVTHDNEIVSRAHSVIHLLDGEIDRHERNR
jgi:putative ABC transport system ATP-binding protein